MTTSSRPPKQPRPRIQLPELPVLRDDHGNRLCAVELQPMVFCRRPGRRNGRCTRCYQREYAAARDRLAGRAAAVRLDEPVKVTAYLPVRLLVQVAARFSADTSESAMVRHALEQWVASPSAP